MSFPPSSPPRRHGNALSPEKERRVVELRHEGLEYKTIAERLGVHFNSVYRYVRRAGGVAARPCSVCGSPLPGRRFANPLADPAPRCVTCRATLRRPAVDLLRALIATQRRVRELEVMVRRLEAGAVAKS